MQFEFNQLELSDKHERAIQLKLIKYKFNAKQI